MKQIAILGSTGSIGENTLKIIAEKPELFSVVALAACSSIKILAAQIKTFRPKLVSVSTKEYATQLEKLIAGTPVTVLYGDEGANAVATHPDADIVVSAMVGAVGLRPTLAAVSAGKQVALANKETLVTAGAFVMAAAKKAGATIIPIDSEHSAIFQALRGEKRKSVKKIILTASGGPFRTWPRNKLASVTPEHALNHPNWSMGPKISIDSATMMNKGLEVIEAKWLFDLETDQIETLVHPQSIIHSMVEFYDRSVIAQLGLPDMRAPIGFALGYPDRLDLPLDSLDLASIKSLTFSKPDFVKFPALKLAYETLRTGGMAPAILNAANEVAVDRFLKGQIGFTAITKVIDTCLQSTGEYGHADDLDAILTVDAATRAHAQRVIRTLPQS
jgi:1-deoxy-D-xylulose-5-phosphate reductoisomerase